MGGLDAQEFGLGVANINLRRPTNLSGPEDDRAALEVLSCYLAD